MAELSYPYYEINGDTEGGGIAVRLDISADGATIDPATVIDAVRAVLAATPGVTGTRAHRYEITHTSL
ncbi:hypothetical protein [Streptomyces naphthomycinicus]|uniref:hypothetical protein n=1 Tax=Streptomyces naphthomycinicus TaxID=2872625 RepID=UPI001CEC6C36|nr:hypothetical protein [Streptomyces sp. TML10]